METIEEAIVDFKFHCQYEKSLSEKTLKAYNTDISQFVNFLDKYNYSKMLISVDKSILKEFIKSISNKRPKTIKRKLATLKALFNYLEFEDHIITNPFRKMRIKIKEQKVLPIVLSYSEVLKIFKHIYKIKNSLKDKGKYSYTAILRDIAVMELLFSTGIRVNELCQLKLSSVGKGYEYILVNGKGSKERIIQIGNKGTKIALREYNSLVSNIRKGTSFFFINRLNNPLSSQSIRLMIRNHVSQTAIQKKVTPHTFRHTFATLLLEEGVDIKYIQHLLGHSSIMTTQIYTHVNTNKQKRILQTKHPRRKFDVADF
jgi:integrase/recombinase XerD